MNRSVELKNAVCMEHHMKVLERREEDDTLLFRSHPWDSVGSFTSDMILKHNVRRMEDIYGLDNIYQIEAIIKEICTREDSYAFSWKDIGKVILDYGDHLKRSGYNLNELLDCLAGIKNTEQAFTSIMFKNQKLIRGIAWESLGKEIFDFLTDQSEAVDEDDQIYTIKKLRLSETRDDFIKYISCVSDSEQKDDESNVPAFIKELIESKIITEQDIVGHNWSEFGHITCNLLKKVDDKEKKYFMKSIRGLKSKNQIYAVGELLHIREDSYGHNWDGSFGEETLKLLRINKDCATQVMDEIRGCGNIYQMRCIALGHMTRAQSEMIPESLFDEKFYVYLEKIKKEKEDYDNLVKLILGLTSFSQIQCVMEGLLDRKSLDTVHKKIRDKFCDCLIILGDALENRQYRDTFSVFLKEIQSKYDHEISDPVLKSIVLSSALENAVILEKLEDVFRTEKRFREDIGEVSSSSSASASTKALEHSEAKRVRMTKDYATEENSLDSDIKEPQESLLMSRSPIREREVDDVEEVSPAKRMTG